MSAMADDALKEAATTTDEPNAREKRPGVRLSPSGFVYLLEHIDGDIKAMDERVNARMDRLDDDIKAVAADLKSLDIKLTNKIDSGNIDLDTKIQNLDAKLTGQIGTLDSRLTGQIGMRSLEPTKGGYATILTGSNLQWGNQSPTEAKTQLNWPPQAIPFSGAMF